MALALRYQECIGAPSKGRWWPQPGDTTYQHGVWKVSVGPHCHPIQSDGAPPSCDCMIACECDGHQVIACECDGHQVIVGTSLANSGFAIIFGALHVSLWMGFVLITAGELKFGHLTAFQGYQMQIVMGIGQVAGAAMQLASHGWSPACAHHGALLPHRWRARRCSSPPLWVVRPRSLSSLTGHPRYQQGAVRCPRRR